MKAALTLAISSLCLLPNTPAGAQGPGSPEAVVLTGHDLTIAEVARLARDNAKVRVDPAARTRVERSTGCCCSPRSRGCRSTA